jgi:molybdopterin-guanine dinucleotide biosynthesis protein A
MQHIDPKKLSVAILAGGKSSRFGDPKAQAYFGENRLIDYSVEIAKFISPNIFVVKHPQQKFQHQSVAMLSDIIPNCGPAGGICTALENIRTQWLAVLPCDMPFLTPDIYEILFKNRKSKKPIVAISENGLESLVSVWPKTLVGKMKSHIAKRELALHKILEELNAVGVSIPDVLPDYQPEIFYNINYKKDLAEMEKLTGLLKSNFLKNMDNIFEQMS